MINGAELAKLGEKGRQYRAKGTFLFCVAVAAAGAGILFGQGFLGSALATIAIIFLLVSLALRHQGSALVHRTEDRSGAVRDFVAGDAVPCFATDEMGEVQWVNRAGEARFGKIEEGETGIARLLGSTIRDMGAISLRLLAKAEAGQDATEDVTVPGGHARLSVHAVGDQSFFWRFEEFRNSATEEESERVPLPLVTVGRSNTILHMNDAARGFVGQRVKTLDQLFHELPPRTGQVNVIATSDGPKPCIVAEPRGKPGRRDYVLLPAPDLTESVLNPAPDISKLPVPLLTVSQDGEILAVNDKARKLIDVSDAVGQKLWDHMEGLGRPIRDWLNEAAEGRNLNRTEFLRLKRSDRETFVQVTLARVDSAGDPVLYVVLNDATELKTLEAQFVQSQKMQAIGQLAGGVAHDFNNLLTAITGHCDLLLLRHDQGDPDYADLVQINQNANRAAALVGQLLAFSRKQTLKAQPLDLRDTMSDLTHLLNRLVGERVEMVLTHDPLLWQIRADKRQLEQVIMNLVVNARDAMTDGGRVEIATSNLSLTGPEERGNVTVPPGDYVIVKVRDEGPGIPPDKIGKVFEPFFTTKRVGEGTGLGLSTAYGIVKQTGGYIFAESVPGEGAEFTLLFPAYHASEDHAAEAPAATQATRRETGGAPQDGVVLLVEDEAPVRAFASRALKLRGFTVLEADCAEAALSTLEDADLNVDVFVTDVVMPGLDGPSWVRQALQSRPGTRVVFMSGYAEDALDDQEVQVPNSVFLPKPFSLTELTETVARQLN